ncbi:MAG TPA: hypothetical protein PLH46_04530 [Caldisericia bacterium]|nr:hypothetical protein [Caldisericia bacterium]
MRIYKLEGKNYPSLSKEDFPNTLKYLNLLHEDLSFFATPEYEYNAIIVDNARDFKLMFVKTLENNKNELIFELNIGKLRKTKKALIKQAHDTDLEMCERIFKYVIETKSLIK